VTALDLASALAGRYTIVRELGQGGMATVYLAHDVKHDRDVALKVLRPELAAILGRERFLNEIRLTARLDHPHIVTLIDSGETEGFLWYVLPYIRGESLRARLTREKQLGVQEALAIGKQVAGALDYAHRLGVIHRDLKPENILLHEGEAMLADFGIALAVKEAGGSRLTETGLSLGTPAYMSPEQATGDRTLDARSDLYSLAAVVYEMLAGEPPHTGATVQAVIAKLMTERPTRLRTVRDTVPEGVDAAVAKALAKVPADRFGSVHEFAALLTTAPGPALKSRGTRRYVLAGAALAILVVIGATIFAHYRQGGAVTPSTPVKMTSSGDVTAAALSPDGTRLATSVKECDESGRCRFALVWRELNGDGQLRIADRLGSLRGIKWSPDNRQLLFLATDSAGRYGAFRVSALGGAVQFLGCCSASFLTTADTTLLSTRDSSYRLVLRVVTPLDGSVHDSVSLGNLRGTALGSPSPNGKLIAALVTLPTSSQILMLDRRWRRLDSVALPRTAQVFDGPAWDPSGDALILKVADSEDGSVAHFERVPVEEGRFGPRAVLAALGTTELGSYSIGGADRTLMHVVGGQEWTISALTRGNPHSVDFRSRLLRRSTSLTGAILSPDGRSIDIFLRPPGSSRLQAEVMPFEGGAAVRVPPDDGEWIDASWTWDSGRLLYLSRSKGGRVTLYSFDPTTRRSRVVGPYLRPALNALGPNLLGMVDDSAFTIPLADTNGVEIRRLADPDSSERGGWIAPCPDGRSIVTSRWNVEYSHQLISRIDLASGQHQRIGDLPVEEMTGLACEADGSIQVALLETLGTQAFYRIDKNGGRPVKLATAPAEGYLFYSFSLDGRRAVKTETRPRGDVWMIHNFDGRARR
jgi:tRNA A-37 threonylcarbamoyl transferase component Bud32/dipeptidyl aminopeptidase/acylaminoacyl peptidase